MLVSYALLVTPNALDCKHALLIGQKPGIELIVWYEKEDDHADNCREEAGEQEDYLPGCERETMLCGSSRYAIGDKSTKYLAEAIKAIPLISTAEQGQPI